MKDKVKKSKEIVCDNCWKEMKKYRKICEECFRDFQGLKEMYEDEGDKYSVEEK